MLTSFVRPFLFAAFALVGLAGTPLPAAADDPPPPPPGHKGHRAPPEEAFTACANLAEEAACTVQLHDRSIEGTCKKAPDERLFCHPTHMPPPPPPEKSE